MRFWNRLRMRMRSRRLASELDDELRLHREMLEEQYIREGMSRRDAARAAAVQLGNATAASEMSREEWTFPRFEALAKDLRFAWRLMWRNPLLTGAAVLTIAFGVGANTTILSVLETILLNPLGLRSTNRVAAVTVSLDKLKMKNAPTSGVEFRELQSMRETFAAVAAVEPRAWTQQQVGTGAARLTGSAVTHEFFRVFDTSPALGRFFTAEDRESVVLSHALWQGQFGGDASVIGRSIPLDDIPHRIVGVARADFRFPVDAMAWTPLVLAPDRLERRGWKMSLALFARLSDQVSLAQAADRLHRHVHGLIAAGENDLQKLGYGIGLDSFAAYLAGELRKPLWLLWAAAIAVLLTACANVAGLLLTRSNSRRREMAIRLSLGATRGQIVRQLIVESLLLGLAGGLAGLAMAKLTLPLLARISVPGKELLGLVTLHSQLLLFGLGLALLSGLLFGLVPALQFLRSSQTAEMARSQRRWFQDIFVMGEVAAAFVLVTLTALLLRSLWAVERIQPGFEVRHITTAYLAKPKNDPGFLDRFEEALRHSPGVESAALAYPVPFTTGGLTSGFQIRDHQRLPGEPELHGEAYFVTPAYFQTLRIPLLKGRLLAEGDSLNAPLVCLIDRHTAERFFPGKDPLGQQIAMYRGWATIIGVVGTVRATTLEQASRPVFYYALPQMPFLLEAAAVIRSTLPGTPIIQDAVRRTHAAVPVYDVRTMEERIGETLGIRRMVASLLAIFGGISLLLAAIGLYGVIAQVVQERTREIGIRLALGAQPGGILRQFLGQGLRAGIIGLCGGLLGAAFAQKWVAAMLYDVRPFDIATFAVVAAGILLLLVLSVWWPALRAARTDANVALRYEG